MLFLIGTLITLTWLIWPPVQAIQDEKQFLKQFEVTYQNTLTQSMFTNQPGRIKVTGRQIKFETFNIKQPVSLIVPETLEIAAGSKLVFELGDSGMIKPGLIKFKSKITKKTYSYAIQMGWGRLHVKTN